MKKLLIKGIFAANILAIIIFWWRGSSVFFADGSLDGALIAFGRLAGFLAELLLMVQLVLISRVPFVERAFGFDQLNRAHRTIGLGLASGIIIHPILIVSGYAMAGKVSFWAQLTDFFSTWPHVLEAAVGLSILLVVAFLSAPFIRRKLKYETWHLAHLFMYLAVGLVLRHQLNSEDISRAPALYYWYLINFTGFGTVLVWRFVAPIVRSVHHRFTVERVVPETHDVTSVYITGRDMERFTFDPGQYVHVIFLQRGFLQPHPFSLSKAPDGKGLRLSIKASGDFTSRIPQLKPGTRILLEGPFGRFTERAAVKGKYLFIAGGIGITPIRSMLEALCRKGADAILLYGNKSDQDVALKAELDAMDCRVRHFIKELIDLEKISAAAPDFRERDIYLCGPPKMMEALISMLLGAGVPKRQLHYEKFSY